MSCISGRVRCCSSVCAPRLRRCSGGSRASCRTRRTGLTLHEKLAVAVEGERCTVLTGMLDKVSWLTRARGGGGRLYTEDKDADGVRQQFQLAEDATWVEAPGIHLRKSRPKRQLPFCLHLQCPPRGSPASSLSLQAYDVGVADCRVSRSPQYIRLILHEDSGKMLSIVSRLHNKPGRSHRRLTGRLWMLWRH